ncbi:hypothetical protein FHS27_006592, partial [Rhodopirellula rubra]|nr:hypothetical protein [Aporhodopirellula rubra]
MIWGWFTRFGGENKSEAGDLFSLVWEVWLGNELTCSHFHRLILTSSCADFVRMGDMLFSFVLPPKCPPRIMRDFG